LSWSRLADQTVLSVFTVGLAAWCRYEGRPAIAIGERTGFEYPWILSLLPMNIQIDPFIAHLRGL